MDKSPAYARLLAVTTAGNLSTAPTPRQGTRPRLVKLGETITETLEVILRQWKVVQTVREKFSCRTCETITRPPAPFHPIARGRAGPELLAMILEASSASTCH